MPRSMLLFLILNTLITLGGVGFNYWMMRPQLAQAASAGGASPAHVAQDEEEPAEYSFFAVDKIVVSVANKSRERYFVLDLALQTPLESDPQALERIVPLIRSAAVTHLSAMSFQQLRGLPIPELQDSLESALLADLAARHIAAPFQHVLVSKLIVQ